MQALQKYLDRDFRSFTNQNIIIEVRELAQDILDTRDILKQGNIKDKTPELRKRLMESNIEIEKIGKIGEEMDGNAS